MSAKIYPESGIELTPFTAKHYDKVMNIGSLGMYRGFIRKVIREMEIMPEDNILDMGCGTGRNASLMCSYLNANGSITGLDISEHMEKQFRKRFSSDKRVDFINRRIDQPFDLQRKYDKVFMSFVIHGFPHEVRDAIIKNAYNHLKPGGSLLILDYAEFDMDEMPLTHRFIFKKFECVYAFDFIKHDWKKTLENYDFGNFSEHLHLKRYVRLLKAVKL